MKSVPDFETIRIGYTSKLAEVNGKKTFGGYVKTAPEGFEQFLQEFSQSDLCKAKELLPPKGIYPVAATAGYLCILPAMTTSLTVIVIPRAGAICLEV